MVDYKILDRRLTDPKKWTAYRKHCLTTNMHKHWITEGNPEFAGLFFIKHKDFLGEIDIAEYHINKKGKGFWLTPGDPSAWSEIETYDYTDQEGNPIYQYEYF